MVSQSWSKAWLLGRAPVFVFAAAACIPADGCTVKVCQDGKAVSADTEGGDWECEASATVAGTADESSSGGSGETTVSTTTMSSTGPLTGTEVTSGVTTSATGTTDAGTTGVSATDSSSSDSGTTGATTGDSTGEMTTDGSTTDASVNWGNGVLDPGESCDWGDPDDPDLIGDCVACSASCQCTKAVGIAAGANHTCVLLDDGHVRCWGRSSNFQTGYSEFELDAESPSPRAYYANRLHSPGDLNIPVMTKIYAGGDRTCFSGSAGITCIGEGVCGASLACPSPDPNSVYHACQWSPADIKSAQDFPGITPQKDEVRNASVGTNHICVTVAAGNGTAVYCWGKQPKCGCAWGECTMPTLVRSCGAEDCLQDHASGYDFSIDTRWSKLEIGQNATYGWGLNGSSQTGSSKIVGFIDSCTLDDSLLGQWASVPESIPVAAAFNHACMLEPTDTSSSTVACWGSNEHQKSGAGPMGTYDFKNRLKVTLPGKEISSIALGKFYTCIAWEQAVPPKSGVDCWGKLPSTGVDAPIPANLLSLDDEHVLKIVSGDGHVCALTTEGAVRCVGNNAQYQAGVDSENAPQFGTVSY
jgi:hypothetical protein